MYISKKDFVKMGSYGIGVSRLVGAIIEAKYDEKNEIMKWPIAVAPYDISIIPMINKSDTSALDKANKIYLELEENNIDTIIDDTDENFSSKIKKMNLIGSPYQIIIGKQTDGDLIEFKELGNDTKKIKLKEIIEIIEKNLGIKAKRNFLPLQPGDVPETFAEISQSKKDLKFKPTTKIKDGIPKFIKWYKSYYKIN